MPPLPKRTSRRLARSLEDVERAPLAVRIQRSLRRGGVIRYTEEGQTLLDFVGQALRKRLPAASRTRRERAS